MIEDPAGFAFPCTYAVKAMGLAEPGFEGLVVALIRRHCPQIREDAVSWRKSRNGKYVSVTVTIMAESYSQLDAIYAELTAHERVLMRL
jgi:putative lipoic acid-binding regulatory protein